MSFFTTTIFQMSKSAFLCVAMVCGLLLIGNVSKSSFNINVEKCKQLYIILHIIKLQ
jgi:hypothetical protein